MRSVGGLERDRARGLSRVRGRSGFGGVREKGAGTGSSVRGKGFWDAGGGRGPGVRVVRWSRAATCEGSQTIRRGL